MKITVYTTADCQFSKAEKEYLTSHNLQYEEKDLETNKEFLTEMLAVSNNFAGTPVTRVEKDDGTIAVLKGFTKEEFDTTFGISTEPPKVEDVKPTEPQATEVKPAEEPEKPAETPEVSPTAPTSPTSQTDEKLTSILDKLEEKTETPPAQPTPTNSTNSTDSTVPPANPPAIPDFSSDIKTTA